MKGPYDSTGFPLGCKSACDANLDGDQGDILHLIFFNRIKLIYLFKPTHRTAAPVSTTPRLHALRLASRTTRTSKATALTHMHMLTMRAAVPLSGHATLARTQTIRLPSAHERVEDSSFWLPWRGNVNTFFSYKRKEYNFVLL